MNSNNDAYIPDANKETRKSNPNPEENNTDFQNINSFNPSTNIYLNSNIPNERNSNLNANPPNQHREKSPRDTSNNQIDQYKKECMKLLYKANDLYKQGAHHNKEFSFQMALYNFEEAKKMCLNVYKSLEGDPKLKAQMDNFLKATESQIKGTNYQIKNQFAIKSNAGYVFTPMTKEIDLSADVERLFNNRANALKEESNKKEEKPGNLISKPVNEKEKEKEKDSSNVVTSDLRDRILSEIVDNSPNIKFDDLIGLQSAKQTLNEIIVLPSMRPDLFTGLRAPPRGLLLFGPPGTGKTMLAKAVATEIECTFFNISASSLTSKYVGESEKLVRALFKTAFEKQPSVVFIDEIDSILCKRSDNENEGAKRLKTEFLVQFDGVGSDQNAKVLIIGATNRPQELDSAVIRRLPRRIYVGPFDTKERALFLKELMRKQETNISDDEFSLIAGKTENYTNSDLKELCREAAYEPIREIKSSDFNDIKTLRPTSYSDFEKALKRVRGILTKEMLKEIEEWNDTFGAK